MRLRLSSAAALVALGLVATIGASSSALGQEQPSEPQISNDGTVSLRLVDAPTSRRDDPRARTYIVDHLRQGDEIERRIEVANSTSSALTIQLYAAAASVKDGQFQFGDGRATNELSRWTGVAPGSVDLPPGGKAQSTVRVRVPGDVVDGERYAVIWAELPASGGQASVVNRVGIRMYLSVGQGAEPGTDFRIDTLTAAREADGRPVVRTRITNTGGRAIDVRGTLDLADGPWKLTAGPFQVKVGTSLGVGQSAPATIVLDRNLPAGPWEATVSIRGNDLTKEARARITFPDQAGTSAKPVEAESVRKQRRVLIPIALLLVLAILVALVLLGTRGSLRKKHDDREA